MAPEPRYLSFPFRIAPEGRVALADADQNLRQRIEQILFTAPGERVMLPEFGSGVRELVFAPNGPALAAATEFTIARALQSQLSREALIRAVNVTAEQEKLSIEIVYTRTRDFRDERLVFNLTPFDRVPRA
jgi:phage baseplate assembly protein W